MIDDPRLKQAMALITESVSEAYNRGKADAIAAMVAAASGAMQPSKQEAREPSTTNAKAPSPAPDQETGRIRAPRGSAEAVIRRAIAASNGDGVTMLQIMAARETVFEKMLVDSSVRGELRRGESAGRYKEINGRWYINSV